MNTSITTKTVGINESTVSDDPNMMLVTYGLGSCIAVVAWEPFRLAGGMIHYSLPQSSISQEKAFAKPTMFGDTGIPLFFRSLYELGAVKENLRVIVVGGARFHDTVEGSVLDIGRRNYLIARRLFWKNNILITTEDVGGTKARTVKFWIQSGKVTVSSQGTEEVLFSTEKFGSIT
jgi:chemotaxis protein CheD